MLIDPITQELRETANIRHGITVKVDLNSKFYFEKNGKFNVDLYSSLEDIVFEITNEKSLEDYLKGDI